jgi:Helix-turn-helix domain
MRKSGEAVPAKTDLGRESGANSPDSQPLVGGGMSYQATGWVLDHSQSILGARLVLHSLAYHMNNETGLCFPSLDTIARECHMTKSGVIQAIERLEQSGEIMVERQDRPGSGSVNRYSMPIFSAWYEQTKLIEIKGKKGKDDYEKGKADEPERVNPIAKKGLQGIPEPEVEPSIKEKKGNFEYLPTLSEGVDPKILNEKTEQLVVAKAERRSRKTNRAAGNFQRTRPTAAPSKIVTNKQPDTWIWFSTLFKRLADANAFSHADLWPMVDEMLGEIGKEEAGERLSMFIDGAEKVTGYLAKDFLTGGWRTIDLEEEAMPRIVNEE